MEAMKKLKEDFPPVLKEKAWNLFIEFEEQETREAQLAKAIDFLDAQVHELDYKKDWQGWTEARLRKYKSKHFDEFPELKEFFEEMMQFCHKERYFEE